MTPMYRYFIKIQYHLASIKYIKSHNHEIDTLHPSVESSCCLFSSSVQDTDELSIEKMRTLEEAMGRDAIPCCKRGISTRTPERAVFEQFSSLVPRGHWDHHRCWLGRGKLEPWNTVSVTMLLKSATDPFYCLFLWEWQFNQRIHCSPRPPDSQSSSWQHYWGKPKVHEILSWRIHEGFTF